MSGLESRPMQKNPDSEFREIFACAKKNSEENFAFEIRNTTQGIRNPPTNDWNPESKFHRQKMESSTWNTKSKAVLESLTLGDEFAFTVQLNHTVLSHVSYQ